MPALRTLPRSFYRRPAEVVARDLLGRRILRVAGGQRLALRIVEVEAYRGGDDPASHAYRGLRRRNASMFLDGGHAYVYLIYGMHHCVNVVCGGAGVAQAVLLRAGEAIEGAAEMARLRGLRGSPAARLLAGGPGRLAQALGIRRDDDGAALWRGDLRLLEGEPVAAAEIAVGRRIGIESAGEAASWPLRFAVRSSRALSRPIEP